MSRTLELWRELNVLAETDAEAARIVTFRRTLLEEAEKLRAAMSEHRSVDFRLGAIYAIDEITRLIRQGRAR